MGETHQDRGYRMAIDIFFWLGKEGRLTFSSCVFAASPFGYRKKTWWCIMIAETSLDNIKVLDTASNATMSGTSKGLENGVLEGSENTKFVGKIRWFWILFVARIRYCWGFPKSFLHFVLDRNEYGGGTDLLCEFFWKPSSVPTRSIGYFKLSTSYGYVWCMRSLPRKFEKKKVSQRTKKIPWRLQSWWSSSTKWQVVSLGRRVVRTVVQTTRIPRWGDSEMDGVCWSGDDVFWRSISTLPKKKNMLWMCAWRSTKKIRSFEPRTLQDFHGFFGAFGVRGRFKGCLQSIVVDMPGYYNSLHGTPNSSSNFQQKAWSEVK